MRRAALALLCVFAAGAASPGELMPGAALYQRGEAASTAEALIGEPPVRAPLALFACAGCHGAAGRGATEGGVTAPDIRWSTLSKPYALRSGPFRRRPAYDEQLFARALREGIDSAGQRFAAAMPRYLLDDKGIAGLIGYLRQLDEAGEASPFGTEIPIGVRLPPGGHAAAERQRDALRAALDAYFGDLNRRGGIFERTVALRYLEPAEPLEAGFAAGLDLALPTPGEAAPPNANLPADEVPVIALFPAPDKGPSAAARFTLYSGNEDRAAALVAFARRTLGIEEAEIAQLGDDPIASPAPSAPRALLYTGTSPTGLHAALATLPADAALLLTGWLESPGLMELARRHRGPVYAAVPPTAHLLGKSGHQILARLAASGDLPADPRMVQLWALAAARTLEAALEKAGRDLGPEALPTILESLPKVETGFGPDLRFSAASHLGARGAVVLTLAPGQESIAEARWIALEKVQ